MEIRGYHATRVGRMSVFYSTDEGDGLSDRERGHLNAAAGDVRASRLDAYARLAAEGKPLVLEAH